MQYREITGLWSARVPDGPDSDQYPDTILLEGHVTFEPQYRVPLVYPGEHIVIEPMHAVIHEGVLYGETVVGDDVVRGPLFLPVTVDENANQSWSWVAKFQGMRLGEYGEEVTLPDLRFQVPAGGDALDLSEVIPVSQSGNTITLRGPGLPDGAVLIFPTLAEAQAWEAENPGKVALTLEGQGPVEPDEPPIPGFLQVLPSDVSATLTVSGASDAEGAVEYAFRVDAGAWSEWQSAPSFTATDLTRDTDYSFQHRVRDVGGNIVEGGAVQARTLTEAPIPYDMAARALNPAFYLPGDGLVNEGWGSASFLQSSNASQDGAALAGWPDARRVVASGYDRFTTGAPMPEGDGQRPFGASIIVHFAGINGGAALYVGSGVQLGGPSMLDVGRESSSATEWDIRVGGQYGPTLLAGPFPLDTPYTGTHVVGVDCDGTTVTYFVDGAVVATQAAAYTWSGFRNRVELNGTTAGAIEWRGFIVDEAPLGPSVHADLADAAGVA